MQVAMIEQVMQRTMADSFREVLREFDPELATHAASWKSVAATAPKRRHDSTPSTCLRPQARRRPRVGAGAGSLARRGHRRRTHPRQLVETSEQPPHLRSHARRSRFRAGSGLPRRPGQGHVRSRAGLACAGSVGAALLEGLARPPQEVHSALRPSHRALIGVPKWVPARVRSSASNLSEAEARAPLSVPWVT